MKVDRIWVPGHLAANLELYNNVGRQEASVLPGGKDGVVTGDRPFSGGAEGRLECRRRLSKILEKWEVAPGSGNSLEEDQALKGAVSGMEHFQFLSLIPSGDPGEAAPLSLEFGLLCSCFYVSTGSLTIAVGTADLEMRLRARLQELFPDHGKYDFTFELKGYAEDIIAYSNISNHRLHDAVLKDGCGRLNVSHWRGDVGFISDVDLAMPSSVHRFLVPFANCFVLFDRKKAGFPVISSSNAWLKYGFSRDAGNLTYKLEVARKTVEYLTSVYQVPILCRLVITVTPKSGAAGSRRSRDSSGRFARSSAAAHAEICRDIPGNESPATVSREDFSERAAEPAEGGDDSGPAGISSYPPFPRKLLKCADKIRAGLDELTDSVLDSVSEGSIELFPLDNRPGDYVELLLDRASYARDPWELVDQGAVVSIDFGTSSTVVGYRTANGKENLMRLGWNGAQDDPAQYENPTVLEFPDFATFEDVWKNQAWRPLIRMSDYYCSYQAQRQLKDHASSGLTNIKTWARRRRNSQSLRLRDEKGHDFSFCLPEVTEDSTWQTVADPISRDVDPIEVYSYCLGLQLNTQTLRGGKIFLNYLLTYPVKFDSETRKRILQGFRRGLLRSLPASLTCSSRWQEEAGEQFSVRYIAPEPVALVASVFPALGIAPDPEAPFLVFDFGGGTTDFAAGFYRRATEEEYDRDGSEIMIEIIRTSGDEDLGGEHIIDLLYMEVLRKNSFMLQEQGISFVCPPGEDHFPGSERLWRNGTDAFGNMSLLRERLRCVWENRSEDLEQIRTDGKIRSIYLQNGRLETVELSLDADVDELQELIRERIRDGMGSFFAFMGQAFKGVSERIVGDLHVIFSGNACRSPLVRELFEQMKNEMFTELADKGEIDPDQIPDAVRSMVPHFEFVEQWQESKFGTLGDGGNASTGSFRDRGKIQVTLKNCVALGALRIAGTNVGSILPGASQEAVSEEQEATFGYFVGQFRNGYLKKCLSKDAPYGIWQSFDKVKKPRLGNQKSYVIVGWSNDPRAAREDEISIEGCPQERVVFRQDLVGTIIKLKAISPAEVELGCFRDENAEDPEFTKIIRLD